jgi:hypothetical protein
LGVHQNLREMNKMELHEDAIKLLKLIKYARYKKQTLYSSFRNTFHIASREYLNRMHHRLEIMDMVIDRLKERYNKTMDKLCMLQ